ncbi:MAG TPA: hypothetical protein VNL15_08015 [Dehalococcoidia bacterium]|nr:hypothetical protein [Dehalococcoidia bacterium]
MPGKKGQAVAASESAVQWLEQELEQVKAQLRKMESQLEQSGGQILDMSRALRRAEDTVNNFAVAASNVHSLQEEMRQLKELLSRLQDRQAELITRTEEGVRQRHTDQEREQHTLSGMSKQLEMIERLTAGYDSRLQALNETLRHVEEEAASLRQSQLNLSRQLEETILKLVKGQETINRLSNSLERADTNIDNLQKQDEALLERLRLQQETVRRTEERVNQVERYLELPQALAEQQERLRFDQERLLERLNALEHLMEEHTQRTTDFIQGMSLLEQRLQTQTGRLLTLTREMETHRDQTQEQFSKMVKTLERQRRRQVEALTQEIKEIRQSDLNYTGE